MSGKIKIDREKCKGCGLCTTACPKNLIVISMQSNKHGYFPAEATGKDCTGCGICAVVCPDAVIAVYRDSDIIEFKSGEKTKVNIIRERA
ncbi:MAG: 4Fe-4S binding protein [Planctomycetota bacterium]